MSDNKASNRGGLRPGAGRPTALQQQAKQKADMNEFKPSINPIRELEKLYKEVKKIKDKNELLIWQAKVDILNKLLPYTTLKKPTESLTESNDKATVITIKGIGDDNDGGIV